MSSPGPKTPRSPSGSLDVSHAKAVWCRNVARKAGANRGTQAMIDLATYAEALAEAFDGWPGRTDIVTRAADLLSFDGLVARARCLGIDPYVDD